MKKLQTLINRLQDSRSQKVVFLSHCLLNENTRYLGGACTPACVREILQQCVDHDLGMVQMPCPEQGAWGGVRKRLLLMGYASQGSLLYGLRRLVIPLFVLYSQWVYWRLARQIAIQIKDYLDSGFKMVGIVGIDGSPSCGVNKTLDLQKSFDLTSTMEIESMDVEKMSALVRQSLMAGSGLFVTLLRYELKRRRINLPLLAHDLMAELEGRPSNLKLPI